MKIIVLMPIRNESWILDTSLRNLSQWADHIIVADQMSDDSSRNICMEFKKVLVINNEKKGHSNIVRWMLLDKARELYGNNNFLICIDADEMVGQGGLTKKHIETYAPGQTFNLPWIQLWKSTDHYRTDGDWGALKKTCAFIDDGKMNYERSVVINDHTARTPISSLPTIDLSLPLLHFEYVAFNTSQIKQAWYRCHELIIGKKSARHINMTYMVTLDTADVETKNVPKNWYDGVELPKISDCPESSWRLQEIYSWFKIYDITFFEPLDIWHIHELRKEFRKRVGREPVSQHFYPWLIALNRIKNKVKYLLS